MRLANNIHARGNTMASYLHTTEAGECDGQPVTLSTYTVHERHITAHRASA
jgi:hypothetical protein